MGGIPRINVCDTMAVTVRAEPPDCRQPDDKASSVVSGLWRFSAAQLETNPTQVSINS
jgi:hypothetical protein